MTLAPDQALRKQLAALKGLENEDGIGSFRMTGGERPLPALAEIGAVLCDQSAADMTKDLSRMLRQWPQLSSKFCPLDRSWFPKDVAALLEYILLLSRLLSVKKCRAAAEALASFYGVDVRILGIIERIDYVQEILTKARQQIGQNGQSLADLAKLHRTEVEGAQLRALLMRVSSQLVTAVAAENGGSLAEAKKLLRVGLQGQKTFVPEAFVQTAREMLLQTDSSHNISMEPPLKRPRQSKSVAEAAQASVQIASAHMFRDCISAQAIPRSSPVIVQDAFREATGFELQGVATLKQAGFLNIYVVSQNEGVCKAAAAQGASVLKGPWEKACAQWADQRFAALYMYAGSAEYLERQVRLAMDLAAKKAVIAYTVIEQGARDFPRQRLRRLENIVQGRNWRPGLQDASFLSYRTDAGQEAVTQVWTRD